MRYLYILFVLLFALPGWAATTYLDQSATEAGCSGTSASPCKELDHIEDDSHSSGDKVLLKCGETWSKSAGDWGAVGDRVDILGETNLTIGAYYLEGATPREVDGSTYKCSDVPDNDPIIDGDVSSSWGTTFTPMFHVEGGTTGLVIQDIKFQNYYRGIRVNQLAAGDAGDAISDITFQRLTFYNFGHQAILVDAHTFANDNISDITIQDSAFNLMQKQFAGGAPGWGNCVTINYADRVVFRRNNLGQCNGEAIVYRAEADDGEIYDNIIWDIDGGALKSVSSDNITVRHNFVIHTGDSTYNNRANAGLVLSSETDDYSGVTDTSNSHFYANIIAGFKAGVWVNDGVDDADVATATNYVYNNTFIDCGDGAGSLGGSYRLPTSGETNQEFEVEFTNNLSVITDTTNGEHYAYGTIHANMNFNGNGWDESDPRDTSYCTSGNCTSGGDITGDPDLVDSVPCGSSWRGCASWSTPSAGDAALGASSDFIDNAANLGSSYDELDPVSEWVDSVVTVDQDSYGAGWEFGAYVYKIGGNQTAASCSAADIQSAIDTSISAGGGVITIPACNSTELWGASDDISVSTDTEYYIRGSGSGQTKIGYNNSVTHSGHMWTFSGSGLKEFSGMYLEGNNSATTFAVGGWIKIYSTNGDPGPSNAIIHDITTKYFDARSTICHTSNLLFYDNTFNQILDGNDYQFDVYDLANVDWEGDGISFPDDFGTNNFNVFFEDNTFYGAHHITSTFVRGKVVFRYNNVTIADDQLTGDNQGNLDAHEPGYGTCSGDGIADADSYYHGGQAYEIYGNTFTRTGTEIGSGYAIRLRSGSNIITNNNVYNQNDGITLVLDNNSTGSLCVDPAYPQDHSFPKDTPTCGTGEGCCDIPDSTYIWGNSFSGNGDNFTTECGGSFVGTCADALAEDSEYFLRAPVQGTDGFTWTAYTYPHPLRGDEVVHTGKIKGMQLNSISLN